MEYCPNCGTKLIKGMDRLLCPNCGLVNLEEPDYGGERSYIG